MCGWAGAEVGGWRKHLSRDCCYLDSSCCMTHDTHDTTIPSSWHIVIITPQPRARIIRPRAPIIGVVWHIILGLDIYYLTTPVTFHIIRLGRSMTYNILPSITIANIHFDICKNESCHFTCFGLVFFTTMSIFIDTSSRHQACVLQPEQRQVPAWHFWWRRVSAPCSILTSPRWGDMCVSQLDPSTILRKISQCSL